MNRKELHTKLTSTFKTQMVFPEVLCLIFTFENKLIFNYTYHLKTYYFFVLTYCRGKNLVLFLKLQKAFDGLQKTVMWVVATLGL